MYNVHYSVHYSYKHVLAIQTIRSRLLLVHVDFVQQTLKYMHVAIAEIVFSSQSSLPATQNPFVQSVLRLNYLYQNGVYTMHVIILY